MEPKMRQPREPAPRHPRRTPRQEPLVALPPEAPVVVTVPLPPPIDLDEAMRARINDATHGLRFEGEHLAFPAYAAMTPEEQGRHTATVTEQNRAWIDAVFLATDAAWFTVVDGEITAASRASLSIPTHRERWEEGKRTGKVPRLFISPRLLETGEFDE